MKNILRQVLAALEDLGMKHYETTGEAPYKDLYDSFSAALEAEDESLRDGWKYLANLRQELSETKDFLRDVANTCQESEREVITLQQQLATVQKAFDAVDSAYVNDVRHHCNDDLGKAVSEMRKALSTVGEVQPASAEVTCIKCGHPTMHAGNICYSCANKEHPDSAEVKPIPDGWQLVPKVPTEEMLSAGCGALGALYGHHGALMAYKSMLAAAPTPAQQPRQESEWEGHLIVTKNQQGHIVAVTRQDDDGRVMSVIAESAKRQESEVASEALAWQPIETAPKDGTVFLGYRDGKYREACRVPRDDCEIWVFGGSSGSVEIAPQLKPTHWMPLPAAPKREALK